MDRPGGSCRSSGAAPHRRVERRRAGGAIAAVDGAGRMGSAAHLCASFRSQRSAGAADAVGSTRGLLMPAGRLALIVMALTTAYFAAWALAQIIMAGVAGVSLWRRQ